MFNFDVWFSLNKSRRWGSVWQSLKTPPTFQRPVTIPKYDITMNHTWLVAFCGFVKAASQQEEDINIHSSGHQTWILPRKVKNRKIN